MNLIIDSTIKETHFDSTVSKISTQPSQPWFLHCKRRHMGQKYDMKRKKYKKTVLAWDCMVLNFKSPSEQVGILAARLTPGSYFILSHLSL